MRHLKSGRKLKRTSSHRKALLRNMATSLFEHKKIFTTEAKAKELRPYAEALITKAKHALMNEKQGLLPEGQKVDIHNRRVVGKHIFSKAVLQELFDTIAPMVEDRPGGYTRIIKTGFRKGDAGNTAVIELVDWSAPQDGAVSKKSRKKTSSKAKGKDAKQPQKAKSTQVTKHVDTEEAEVVENAVIGGEIIETSDVLTETTIEDANDEVIEANVEKPVLDVPAEVIEESPAEVAEAPAEVVAEVVPEEAPASDEPITEIQEENSEAVDTDEPKAEDNTEEPA